MANTTLKTRILLNNKTAAEWAKDTETVWLKGEFLIESDTKKCKIGDGVKKYNELTYAYLTPEEVNSIVAQSSHTHSNKTILDATTASFTTALLQKLNAIAAGAEVNVQSDWNITDVNSDSFIKNKPTSMPASDVSSWAKAPTKPTYTATEVGAEPTGSSAKALSDAKAYADKKIADLVNDAPETMDTLKEVVRDLFEVFKETEEHVHEIYPEVGCELPEEITFITSQELLDMYPHLTPKEREDAIVKEKKAVFLMQIGKTLSDGKKHDGRSPDYDDWDLNGDILFYNSVLDQAIELSSMGIRVDEDALERQLKAAGCEDRKELDYHKALLAGKLPYTIGGGIGQSRICMFFLNKAHIGEVQVGIWPEKMIEECSEAGIELL